MMRMLGEIIAGAICLASVASCGLLVAAYIWFEAPPVSLLLAMIFASVAAGAAKVADNLSQ